MRIPLDKVSDGAYLEPGVYQCFITDISEKVINDKDAVKITFKDSITGATAIETFFCTQAALWRIKKLARAAGVTEAEFQNFDTADLRGRPVVIEIRKETANDGKEYSRVQNNFAPWKREETQKVHWSPSVPKDLPEKQINEDYNPLTDRTDPF